MISVPLWYPGGKLRVNMVVADGLAPIWRQDICNYHDTIGRSLPFNNPLAWCVIDETFPIWWFISVRVRTRYKRRYRWVTNIHIPLKHCLFNCCDVMCMLRNMIPMKVWSPASQHGCWWLSARWLRTSADIVTRYMYGGRIISELTPTGRKYLIWNVVFISILWKCSLNGEI